MAGFLKTLSLSSAYSRQTIPKTLLKDILPTNDTIEDVLAIIKDDNIIPVIDNSNIDIVDVIQSSIPDSKVSTVVVDEIPAETVDTIANIAASVPSVDKLDVQARA